MEYQLTYEKAPNGVTVVMAVLDTEDQMTIEDAVSSMETEVIGLVGKVTSVSLGGKTFISGTVK